MGRKPSKDLGNYISEWFGHRIFPTVVSDAESLRVQTKRLCPFLSDATASPTPCIKGEASRGVCTISSVSNGPRQDWLVCPYRAFDRTLMDTVAARLYQTSPERLQIFAAPTLADSEAQNRLMGLLDSGVRVLVYFDLKMGGEIQLPATPRSPQIAFDVTFVELLRNGDAIGLGRFAVMEIQTMDFHGSYGRAVANLNDALRLHRNRFPTQVHENPRWLAEKIEGPNIANVFKRTFWQLMFKFELSQSETCAGVALTIPQSVWDSWQRFLGAPDLVESSDGTFLLPHAVETELPPTAWIYIFDFDHQAPVTPSPMRIQRIVRTSAKALAHQALEEAPKGAIAQLETGLYGALRRRLQEYLPLEIRAPTPAPGAVAVRVVEEPLPSVESDVERTPPDDESA